MRTSEQIKAEIGERFGFFPPFFAPALENPQVLENLWQQTLNAYVNNPLSTLLKEKLFAYLSRYCSVPYCIVCHSCALRPLGMSPQDVLALLESPNLSELEIEKHFTKLAAQPNFLTLPEANSALEESLFYCAVYIFVEGEHVQQYRDELCRCLGTNYHHLVSYLAYIKTCHIWVEANPEVVYEFDPRVQAHLAPLLEQEPYLKEFFSNYKHKVALERQTQAVKLAQIAERKRNEESLRQSEARLRFFIEHTPVPVAMLDRNMRYLLASHRWLKDYSLDKQIIGRSHYEVFPISERWQKIHQHCLAGAVRKCEEDLFPRADGTTDWVRWEIHPWRDNNSEIGGIIIFAEVITERKQAEIALHQAHDELEARVEQRTNQLRTTNEQLHNEIVERQQIAEQLTYNALHDALTGLPNRAFFMESLERVVDYCKQHEKYLFAVLFFDLDRFKVINDSLGHILGDQFLIAIACRLKSCLRPKDLVARLGGDEFVVLLEEIADVEDAVKVAERIQAQLLLPVNLGTQNVSTTASIGIALSNTSDNNPVSILRDADIAMYRAKAQGRASHEVFNADMHTLAVARLRLESDLHRAVERQEFRVHYQPIVSMGSGKITGFEALVRWQHPLRGLISPVEFIPVAEETGLIVAIGLWVLNTACQDLHAWQMKFATHPPLTVSVNLSAKQFTQPNLLQQISQILQAANLDAHSLSLEVTESLAMENSDATINTLLQLRELGIQLSIDDFGTGYSSLGRLHNLPINVLKIDRSFVSNIGVKQGNIEIVEAIVTLAHKLGLEVTAEGVENAAQLAALRNLKCNYGQGYFCSQPLPKEAVEILIASNRLW